MWLKTANSLYGTCKRSHRNNQLKYIKPTPAYNNSQQCAAQYLVVTNYSNMYTFYNRRPPFVQYSHNVTGLHWMVHTVNFHIITHSVTQTKHAHIPHHRSECWFPGHHQLWQWSSLYSVTRQSTCNRWQLLSPMYISVCKLTAYPDMTCILQGKSRADNRRQAKVYSDMVFCLTASYYCE